MLRSSYLDALVARADERLAQLATRLGTATTSGADAAPSYASIDEAGPLAIARYRNQEVTRRFRDYFITQPLAFQTELFRALFASGTFRDRPASAPELAWGCARRCACSHRIARETGSEHVADRP